MISNLIPILKKKRFFVENFRMMAELNGKIAAFLYFTQKVKEKIYPNGLPPNNDLGKIKLFKLHFFTVAATTNLERNGLLQFFNNFYAFPYGPVEFDIYNSLNNISDFLIINQSLSHFDERYTTYVSDRNYEFLIDSAISELSRINEDIWSYSTVDLIELSHRWNCWLTAFTKNRNLADPFRPIDNNLIIKEIKQFIV